MIMKLPIIIVAGTLTAAVAYNAYALTCGAQPSCADLGYKDTGATTNCLNEPLKCPFNSSYFNCVKKADAVKNMVLDWSKKKLINPVSSIYYVSSYGIIIGRIQDILNQGAHVMINGNSVSETGWQEMNTFFYSQVSPGDSITANGRNPNFFFVPYKNI